MIRYSLAVGPALLLLSHPAAAADPNSLSCIQRTVGADGPRLSKVVGDGLMAKSADALKPDLSPVVSAVSSCATANKWSERARIAAGMIAFATIYRPAVERVLVADRIDPGVIVAMYRSMTLAQRIGFIADDTRTASATAFAAMVEKRGIRMTGDVPNHAGMFLAILAILEFKTAEFTQS